MAEKEVKKVEEAVAEAARTGMKKRGHYDFLSDENKAKVAKMLYSTVLLHHCDILKERPKSTVRGWESKLKEDMHSVAQGKSDTDKSNFVSIFAAKKNREASPCWRGCGESSSRTYQGIQGFCMCC